MNSALQFIHLGPQLPARPLVTTGTTGVVDGRAGGGQRAGRQGGSTKGFLHDKSLSVSSSSHEENLGRSADEEACLAILCLARAPAAASAQRWCRLDTCQVGRDAVLLVLPSSS